MARQYEVTVQETRVKTATVELTEEEYASILADGEDLLAYICERAAELEPEEFEEVGGTWEVDNVSDLETGEETEV